MYTSIVSLWIQSFFLWKAKRQNGHKAKAKKPQPTAQPLKKKEEEDDEIDPLDAFMMTIDKEVNKGKSKPPASLTTAKGMGGKTNTITATKGKAITVVKTVVVKKEQQEPLAKLNKPEVMEQNQDALEYSSEEETPTEITASDFSEAKVTSVLIYKLGTIITL